MEIDYVVHATKFNVVRHPRLRVISTGVLSTNHKTEDEEFRKEREK